MALPWPRTRRIPAAEESCQTYDGVRTSRGHPATPVPRRASGRLLRGAIPGLADARRARNRPHCGRIDRMGTSWPPRVRCRPAGARSAHLGKLFRLVEVRPSLVSMRTPHHTTRTAGHDAKPRGYRPRRYRGRTGWLGLGAAGRGRRLPLRSSLSQSPTPVVLEAAAARWLSHSPRRLVAATKRRWISSVRA